MIPKVQDLRSPAAKLGGGNGMRGLMYKLHRWVAVTVGLVLLIWVSTGLVLTLPAPSARAARPRPPVDYESLSVSPADAVGRLARALGQRPEVMAVTLGRVRETVVYQVALRSGETHLIDARSGESLMITPELARAIAEDDFAGGRVRLVERIERHEFRYPWGPLPAYRVAFDDRRATITYVATSDGSVRRGNRWTRARAAFTSFHDFWGLRVLIKRDWMRRALMVFFGVVALATVASGYTLALQRRWRIPMSRVEKAA